MEKSIKGVEKLVHATNTALAQMKYTLTFDDPDEDFRVRNPRTQEDWLDLCQQDFMSEASAVLMKTEKFLNSNEFSSARQGYKARVKMKEINRKMECLRLEKRKPKETERSRQKLLSLTNGEELKTSGRTNSRASVCDLRTPKVFGREQELTPRRSDNQVVFERTSLESKEELRSKILETQEIVDRGFHTARQLIEKVECMTSKIEKKSPEKRNAENETNFKNSGASQKSEGDINEDENVKRKKCCKHRRKEEERRQREKGRNSKVVDVKREEIQSISCSKLKLQRLPSVHIRGGLQFQKILNLGIFPENVNAVSSRANTAINVVSHEEMEKEKADRLLEQIKRKHCRENRDGGNYVECSNCGKLVRVQERSVDPKKLEEVLQQCNFNVFDPRIDELVESHNYAVLEAKPKAELGSHETPKRKTPERTFKIKRLSDQVSWRYKREAENLKDGHLKLDSILQTLFRRIEESREVFEDCLLFSKKKKTQILTTTQPVVVSFISDDKALGQRKHKKLSKRDVKNRKKRRTSGPEPETTEDEEEEKDEAKITREREMSKEQPMDAIQVVYEGTVLLKEGAVVSTPENSENDYESDFEGESDLLEDRNSESEEPFVKKLSTILEVDSELEKKFSEDTLRVLTPKSPIVTKEAPKSPEPENVSSGSSLWPKPQESHSCGSGKSGKNLRNGSKTSSSQKSTPTELVSSLKDILSALKDQFARTESLAEKLTENAKSPQREVPPDPWPFLDDTEFLARKLGQITRKHSDASPSSPSDGRRGSAKSQEETSPRKSLGGEGGSSVGEVIGSRRKSCNSSTSEDTFMHLESDRKSSEGQRRGPNSESMVRLPHLLNPQKELHSSKKLNTEEILYSEGEIPSNILLGSESGSAHSVGEVLTE